VHRLEQRLMRRPDVTLERLPTRVLRENFHVSVSGNYHTASLIGVLLELGADRVMFASDHPFEEIADGAGWFDAVAISEADRQKIGRLNAQRLLRL
jgi:predicted TIM-barrel fold metal-dependent hydrolase